MICPRCTNGQIVGSWALEGNRVVATRECLQCGYDPDTVRRAPTAAERERAHGAAAGGRHDGPRVRVA